MDQSHKSRREVIGGSLALAWMVGGGLTTAIGLLVSFFKTDIANAWPLGPWPGTEWTVNGPAFSFWICLLLWPVLFIYREYVKSKETKRLQAAIANIEETVQTMPLGAFVRQFGLAICKSEDSLCSAVPRTATPSTDLITLREIVRALLSKIATIAATYDGRVDARYAANVMFFLNETELKQYPDLPVLGGRQATLKGALVLLGVFSVDESSENQDELDTSVALPVPQQANEKSALPGAPRVYLGAVSQPASKRMATHGIDNIRTFDFATELGWDENQVADIRKYYSETGQGKTVCSFMSFPLFGADKNAIIAVLNIHCSQPNWINGGATRKGNAVALLMPLVNETGSIMRLLLD